MKRVVLGLIAAALIAPGAAEAAFPGANGKIAFVRAGDIWTMNPDGTAQVNLTSSAAEESNPAWSPDGNRIAFDRIVDTNSNRQLFVMFADGTGVTQITSNAFGYSRDDPAWSPDGTQLAYSAGTAGAIAKVDADGSNDTVLLYGDAPFAAAWSPAGSRIAFTDETFHTGNCVADVLTVDTDGSDLFNVTCANDYADFSIGPSWSPDATRIAYSRDDLSTQPLVTTIDPDGTDRATFPGVDGYAPAWSPDGSKIAHHTQTARIKTVNANGTGVLDLADGRFPDWQPLNQPGPEADVLASLVDSPDPVAAGAILTYTAQAKNLVGPDDASGVTLTLNLPAGVFFVSASASQGSCAQASGVVSCNVGNLPEGSSASVTVQVEPQLPGTLNATAVVSATEGDPVPGNNSASAQTTVTYGAYARPKGATPARFALVPAFRACDSGQATITHGPPLTHPSCASPALASGHLTVGTPDANGAVANSAGFVKITAIYEPPPLDPGNGDQDDVGYQVNLTDVRNATGLTDYTGELTVQAPLRITDRDNSPSGNAPATMSDTTIDFDVPCTATASPSTGSTCAVSTTAEALLPGLVKERKRAIWELGKVRVLDGGADGDADTGPNTLFATSGLFVP